MNKNELVLNNTENNKFDLHKTKQFLIRESHQISKKSNNVDMKPLQICIHSQGDIFGYQELTKGDKVKRIYNV
jgi:hypothetical protein